MKTTWRWFGPNDKITLEMLSHIGVAGIVTSLHDIPTGQVWERENIANIKQLIESRGLRWLVVESLPVSEEIKYAGPKRDYLINNYIKSLENLGHFGIRTVCYNFMPVIDWVRTDLSLPLSAGSSTLYFNYAKYAWFDIDVIGRKDAEKDYSEETLERVDDFRHRVTLQDRQALIDTIIVKTQGFINGNIAAEGESPVEHFRSMLKLYSGVTRKTLFSNLIYFLDAIMPTCQKYGINMCIHPDDPPIQVFGLPRIAGTAKDLRKILNVVNLPNNGLTFCAGSLSAGSDNDVEAMAREFATRTHFVHLRSCICLPDGDFIEASHINGSVDLAELIRIFDDSGSDLPMRVDHGITILGDEDKGYNPGYSFHGRMLALGQIEGMMAAIKSERARKKK